MISEKSFEIDFKKLVLLWLPTFLRQVFLFRLIYWLISPVESIYVEFHKRRKQNLIKLNHNYQVYSLRKRLNDAFDSVERRIQIVSAKKYEKLYLFTEAEDDIRRSKTLFLEEDKPIYLYTEGELNNEYDFIVLIPNTAIDQIRMKAEIDFYKLKSKTYKIEFL
ncbi:MAG: hypothetical protein KBA33_08045 [Cloacibacterium sp.]|nr:hypothetical protein [Cloacibacterium sp.]